MQEADPVRVEYVALRDLVRWPSNPKRHDEPGIEHSIRTHGFVQPLLLDERTGRLVAGHGRLDALSRMRDSGEPPPRRIRTAAGDWLVPVLRGISFASEADAERYLLADNQLTTAGGWDEHDLGAMLARLRLSDVDLGHLGWEDADLAALMEPHLPPDEPPGEDPGAEAIDRAEELRQKWGVEPGDVWTAGEHRIVCGDSERVLSSPGWSGADLCMTDPPYEMATDRVRRILLAAAPRCAVLTAQGQAFGLCDDSLRFRLDFCWLHGTPRSFNTPYQPIFYHNNIILATRGDEPLGWSRPRLDFGSAICDGTGGYEAMAFGQAKHDTPFREVLAGFAAATVVDPFLGSGAVVIACEKLRRRCIGIEIDPRRVAVCLDRLRRWGLRCERTEAGGAS
jgi:hypothetical protein